MGKKKEIQKIIYKIIILFLTSSVIAGTCYLFLTTDKLKGPEFVALTAIIIITGLIFIFSENIKKITVLGNIIELKDEAEQIVKNVKESQLSLYKIMLRVILKFKGTGYKTDGPDERRIDFWSLYADIERLGLTNILSNELLEVVEELISYSEFRLSKEEPEQLPPPDEYYSKNKNKVELITLEDYKKLYEIREKLTK